MIHNEKPGNNNLTIRLAESAVYLRTDDFTGRSRDSRPSLLRGLLTLELVKPTRISSIEIELTAKTSTAWPEGIGARRIEIMEEHTVYSASTVYFHASHGHSRRRTASIGPGTSYPSDEAIIQDLEDDTSHEAMSQSNEEMRRIRRPSTAHVSRRISIDGTSIQYGPFSHHEDLRTVPTPPYTPRPSSPVSTPPDRCMSNPIPSTNRSEESPAQTLEDLRRTLRGTSWHDHRGSVNGLSEPPLGFLSRPRSRSRQPSIEGIPENEPGPSVDSSSRSPHMNHTSLPDDSHEQHDNHLDHRGRKRSRFSLTSVSNAILDAVRPLSFDDHRDHTSRERRTSLDFSDTLRGHNIDKGKGKASSPVDVRHSKERSAFSKFGEMLRLDHDDKIVGDGWKEFKKGTYTYPISFQIPGYAPPTLQCNYGSVIWRLKAVVHRPGAFKSKLSAIHEVNVIACPGNEGTEDTENIIVERQWDDQLQYFISISGRSFYIGGTVPVIFTLMPLAKIKIHRISVYIEQKVDYYTQMKRVARTDPISRILLLSLKHENNKTNGHILPLDSDDVDAFKKSPLYSILNEGEDPSEVASQFMGPGPWSFHQELRLPTSCSFIYFSNRNKRSNITITHVLKCVIRVERGDEQHIDPKTGKRKLFDIVIQTPVHLLSCRCNPDWVLLPQYSETTRDFTSGLSQCPCDASRKSSGSSVERVVSHSSDSSVSTVATFPINSAVAHTGRRLNSLLDRNTLFERLVAGQESEAGELPPSYEILARAHSAPESISPDRDPMLTAADHLSL